MVKMKYMYVRNTVMVPVTRMLRDFALFHGMLQREVFHVTRVALEVRCWFWCRT